MGDFKGNKFKYVESELKDRGVGRYIDNTTQGSEYRLKKTTYSTEGVWVAFTTLRNSFRAIFQDASNKGHEIAFIPQPLCNKCAQLMIDTFLFRRCRGEEVSIPKEVVPVNAAPDEKMSELLDAEDFGAAKVVSANTEIRWIFNNMKMADVDKKTAPSTGAYALLKELQGNEAERQAFYRSMYPKLMTKEDAEKGGKLHDDGKETIQLLERLLEAAESEE